LQPGLDRGVDGGSHLGVRWGENGEPVELSSPAEVLRRVFTRVQTAAEERRREEEEEREESRRREERTEQLLEACRRVLGELEER
jgi:hypothetical protein